MDKAIAKAAQLAKTEKYNIKEYPNEKDFAEKLLEKTAGNGGELDAQLRVVLGAYYEPFVLVRTMKEQSPVQARVPFILNIK